MYSERCLTVVKEELTKLGMNYLSVELGVAEFDENISVDQLRQLHCALSKSGYELQEQRKLQLVEKIKEVIVEYIKFSNGQLSINFSDHLSLKLQYDYTYLANVFSKQEGITIERFIINHKIQRAKILIGERQLKLTEVAMLLHYSSIAHFSNQFKQVSGLTPSAFRKQICNQHLPVFSTMPIEKECVNNVSF